MFNDWKKLGASLRIESSRMMKDPLTD